MNKKSIKLVYNYKLNKWQAYRYGLAVTRLMALIALGDSPEEALESLLREEKMRTPDAS